MLTAKLDRELQKEMLTELSIHYPNRVTVLKDNDPDDQREKVIANLLYLQEHGLVIAGVEQFTDGRYYTTGSKITADGIDFLADDGGLRAILGAVTVKFHEDTLRAIIEDRITAADLPQPDKKRLLDGLRSLPAESIKHLTMKLLDKGMENWPAALLAIQTFVTLSPK